MYAKRTNESSNKSNRTDDPQHMQFLAAARKRLRRKHLTPQQKRDLSREIDSTIQNVITDRAFAPPHDDPHRILSGVDIIRALCTQSYGLSAPYHLVSIQTILNAIAALTAYVKQFAKDNSVLTKEEQMIETRMADEAFRLLQRLVTGSGIRVPHPYVREAEFTRILDAFCAARRMDMAERVVALQDRASNAPAVSAVTYSVLLRGYGRVGDEAQVTRVYQESQSRGIKADTIMLNSLMDAYIQCGEISSANAVFRRMRRGEAGAPANVRTYNTILKGWAEAGRLDQVQRLAKDMEQQDDLWDNITVNTIVHAAVLQKDWKLAEETLGNHAMASEWGNTSARRHPHAEAYTALLHGYSEAGMIDEALRVYDEMDQRNVTPTEITFSCVLRVHGVKLDMSAADVDFQRMRSMGMLPSAKVFGALILGLTNPPSRSYRKDDADHTARFKEAMAILDRMIDCGCLPPPTLIAVVVQFMSQTNEPDPDDAVGLVENMTERNVIPKGNVIVWTALMKYYLSIGFVSAALKTFQEIDDPDVAALNELLHICNNCGYTTRVMDVFRRNFAPRGKVAPDIITFSIVISSLLSGTYSKPNFMQARKWYKHIKGSADIVVDNAFVDILLKQILRAEVIECLTRPDVYFIAAILNDAETLKWEPGQLERRKRVARGMLAPRLEVLFGDPNFLDTLLPPDSDSLFRRKGWNQVDSGFKVLRMSQDNDEDRFLEENGWNSVDSGFRLF